MLFNQLKFLVLLALSELGEATSKQVWGWCRLRGYKGSVWSVRVMLKRYWRYGLVLRKRYGRDWNNWEFTYWLSDSGRLRLAWLKPQMANVS